MKDERFEFTLDGVPYGVTATPFDFNGERRYRVIYDGVEHLFTWDASLGRLAPINDEAATLPLALEEMISARLESSRRI